MKCPIPLGELPFHILDLGREPPVVDRRTAGSDPHSELRKAQPATERDFTSPAQVYQCRHQSCSHNQTDDIRTVEERADQISSHRGIRNRGTFPRGEREQIRGDDEPQAKQHSDPQRGRHEGSRLHNSAHDVFLLLWPNARLSCRGRLQERRSAENQDGGPGQLEPLDTYHGLDWDGPGPVPMVYGLEAAKLLPKRGIFRKGVAFQPRCVSTIASTNFTAESIFTPEQCTCASSTTAVPSSCIGKCPPSRGLSWRRSPHSVKASSWPASASSAGTGWPTCARRRTSPSCSATHCT